VLDGQQRLTSCYRAFFNNTGVDRYAGRYYFDYGRFLRNPELLNSEVEELVIFKKEKEVNKSLSDTAKEQGLDLFPLDIILQEPRGTSPSRSEAPRISTILDQLRSSTDPLWGAADALNR
jgi:hypothetical protein